MISFKFLFFSGRVFNESQSIFNYSLSRDNFTYYSKQLHDLTFLDNYVHNISALLTKANISHNETVVDEIYTTCRNNSQCLLAVARTEDTFVGKLIMDELAEEEYEKAKSGK